MKTEQPQAFRTTVRRGGMATAGLLGTLAGAHALRRIGAAVRWPARRDELREEDFTLLDRDLAHTVLAEDGVPLAVREYSGGNPVATVVFVHGFCNSMESWHFQRRDLEKLWGSTVRMLFFDLRGHGRSGVPDTDSCTVPQLGRDLAAVIRECAPRGPIMLVGHSMGGMAILAAAAQFPKLFADRVRAVALLSTAAAEVTSAGVAQLLRNPAIDGFRAAVLAAPALAQAGRVTARQIITPILHVSSFHGDVSPTLSRFTTAMIDQTSVATIVKFLKALELHDESAALTSLEPLPALVLGGVHDLVIPFRNSLALARRLPDADLVRVTDAAHMVHLQYPELVNAALDRLLARSGALGRARRKALHG
ncbi:alpha/beta fold hydrolase [Nocardia pseudobrasiliensis]|uniref:Pimeloyl-ACP methyl ester carboxylesterase n=1 Tax=Nocardia pseudobrasiliensis TaxID=45979 RepID=A0A370I117_9NOCA|nr:alpha/beta hydrolase [Nocardia pseudobrasiliensis]RDI64427.1 pimeloyl-ACP methyl ester carboxylesterase [Nocardia pseudobrasiliensis]